MDKYLKAMRAAASACRTHVLKPAFDCIINAALQAYKAGELSVVEYYWLVNEYTDVLMNSDALLYAKI